MTFRLLRADEIEVKVKQVTANGIALLLYKTARTDMDLLDEEVGPENWQCEYETIKDNLYCKIGVWCESKSQWIWKQDCGIESRADGDGNEKKGEASDAFKRAGFKWGIGRELYTSPFIWVKSDVVPTVAAGKGYKMANAFERFHVSKIQYNEKREITALEIANDKNRTVYTFGTKTAVKVAPMAQQTNKEVLEIQMGELSDQVKAEIQSAQTIEELMAVYKSYEHTEPLLDLKHACAVRRAELG